MKIAGFASGIRCGDKPLPRVKEGTGQFGLLTVAHGGRTLRGVAAEEYEYLIVLLPLF